MSVLDNFESWKDFLGDKMHNAEGQGLTQQAISNLAFEVGDYLATKVEPRNEQEAILRDLWNVASNEEKHAIASMMVKLVQNEGNTH
ncbi:DUF3243 domain-containing protein [Salirhabdus sp. Marseille-P4669]|uniref:DUF3243 domain-containing protein n=1 Tax=Salirhabdus sp. Marseille-P4669 TaxID=2042310 RepID=UPI000C7D01A7|nr:DUF3243 domain-containing protein [Salirhabdus sp. Marseille-P4669]